MGDPISIIGGSAVSETFAPAIAAPTAQTTVPLVKRPLPYVPSVNAVNDTASFIHQIETGIQPNPLNLYWQPAYHFRLFLAGDSFTLNNLVTLQSLASLVNTAEQVIIAETGVTGYNIKDVEFETVNAQNGVTREQKATTVTMTITEPLGISFLDALFAGASLLNIWDYTKVNYFLALSFTGYHSDTGPGQPTTGVDGAYAGNPIKFPPSFVNGGQWVWALKFTKIEVKLNEGGGVYTLHFVTTEAESVIIEEKEFSTMNDGLTVKGKTVGEMLDDFANQLTQKWAEKFKDASGKSLMTFKIVTHPIPWLSDKDPKDFTMINQKPNDSSVRSLSLSDTAIPTAQVAPPTTVNEFITSVIKSTEQGQMLIVDVKSPAEYDSLGAETTPSHVRTSTLFSIEPVIDHVSVDAKTHNYVKNVTLHVVPTYSQTPILTPKDPEDAKSPQVQRTMITNLQQQGFLQKEYDYIFTGLNTEVTDFHIDFQLNWNAMLPKLGGARMQALNETVNASRNSSITVDPHPDTPPPDVSNINIQPIPQSPNAQGGRTYIEDILTANNQGQTSVLPITFYSHGPDIEREAGTGLVAQWHPGLSIAATVFAQVFANTMTNAFQKIELNIRGDPYWLGQDNLQRRVVLAGGGPTNNPNDIPDGTSGNPGFILKFKYPLQLGDDFTPVLKDSVVFNGIYEVWKVKHSFTDGAFKQTLFANRMPLINLALASSTVVSANNVDQPSPPNAAPNQSGSRGTPNDGATAGTGSSTIAPTGGPPNSAKLQGLAQESYNFWTSNGYSPAGAAAMVSQEEAEGQFGTAANLNVAGVQAGNFQWSPSREAAIQAATGIDVSDPNTTHQQQLQAALWEQTQGPYKNVGSQLMTATDPGAAGVLATTKYEIPAKTQLQAQIRGGRAAYWGGALGGTST